MKTATYNRSPTFLVTRKNRKTAERQWVGNPGTEFSALTVERNHAERFLDEGAAQACARALNYVDTEKDTYWEVETE